MSYSSHFLYNLCVINVFFKKKKKIRIHTCWVDTLVEYVRSEIEGLVYCSSCLILFPMDLEETVSFLEV